MLTPCAHMNPVIGSGTSSFTNNATFKTFGGLTVCCRNFKMRHLHIWHDSH